MNTLANKSCIIALASAAGKEVDAFYLICSESSAPTRAESDRAQPKTNLPPEDDSFGARLSGARQINALSSCCRASVCLFACSLTSH